MERDTGDARPLYAKPAGGEKGAPLLGSIGGLVWSPDGSGFYAAALGPAGMGSYVYYYDLARQLVEPVRERQLRPGIAPYGIKGRDSLLVLSTDEAATGDSLPGFYFMNTETGEYLEHT